MKTRFFRRFTKTGVLLVLAGVGFATGAGILAYARSIPGIDRPYDPPNYYSPTSISWADTANPSFFYRDVGWNGGNVYDYTRHIKSILYDEKFASWLELLLGKNKVAEDNAAQLSDSQKQNFMNDYGTLAQQLNSNWKEVEDNPEVFNMHYSDGMPTRKLDYREMSAYLNDTYLEAVNSAARREEIGDGLSDAVYTALDNSNNAIGETQAYQSGSQIDAIKQLAIGLLTQSIGAQAQMRGAHALQEKADKQQQELEQSRQRLLFLDPRDPADKEMLDSFEEITGYTRYQSKSMPDFH